MLQRTCSTKHAKGILTGKSPQRPTAHHMGAQYNHPSWERSLSCPSSSLTTGWWVGWYYCRQISLSSRNSCIDCEDTLTQAETLLPEWNLPDVSPDGHRTSLSMSRLAKGHFPDHDHAIFEIVADFDNKAGAGDNEARIWNAVRERYDDRTECASPITLVLARVGASLQIEIVALPANPYTICLQEVRRLCGHSRAVSRGQNHRSPGQSSSRRPYGTLPRC